MLYEDDSLILFTLTLDLSYEQKTEILKMWYPKLKWWLFILEMIILVLIKNGGTNPETKNKIIKD